jgi:hypothetical protein
VRSVEAKALLREPDELLGQAAALVLADKVLEVVGRDDDVLAADLRQLQVVRAGRIYLLPGADRVGLARRLDGLAERS